MTTSKHALILIYKTLNSILAIIIGCSGSTGSSLLKTILNRHSQIFAGPETCLFAYPQVFDRWEKNKRHILTNITTDGWVIRKGMVLLQSAFGWQKKELAAAIATSNSFQQFVNTFFEKPLSKNEKKYWIEKTPVNAYGFRTFLSNYPNGKVIQIVRNPYDTVASLMARGMNAYYAAGYYVYNTAIATSVNADSRYYQLYYEDLVARPIPTLKALFDFLDIPFEADIINARNESRAEPTTMDGWKHHETATIASSSINRFQELSEEQKAFIKTALSSFEIHPVFRKKHHIHYKNCASICDVLNYDYWSVEKSKKLGQLRRMYWRDRFSRIKHKGWTGGFDYPGILST